MTRPIKFRAWFPSIKEMGKSWDLEWLKETTEVPKDFTKKALFNDQAIFMQFTGLTDKNRKEIYEGDIISCTEGKHKDTIELGWVKGRATMPGYGYIWSTSKELVIEPDGIGERYEVIGNIYENPNLTPI